MDVKRFKEIAAALLTKHYGLNLNDTHLWDDSVVAECIKQSYRPYQVVAEHAAESDLDRIDKSDYGVPSKAAITVADEDTVIQHLPIPSIELASQNNDYVKALSMVEAFAEGSGSMCSQNRDETLAMFKPNRRTEAWFLKMVEMGRGYLTEEEQMFALNDRYGETIIGERHDEYDALEIQGVRDHNLPGDPEGSCCEVDNENPQFFSVYAHLREGGVECVGDFATHILAETYAKELATKYNWPIHDYASRFKEQKLMVADAHEKAEQPNPFLGVPLAAEKPGVPLIGRIDAIEGGFVLQTVSPRTHAKMVHRLADLPDENLRSGDMLSVSYDGQGKASCKGGLGVGRGSGR